MHNLSLRQNPPISAPRSMPIAAPRPSPVARPFAAPNPPQTSFFLSNSARAGEVSRRGSRAPRSPALAGFQKIPRSQDAQRFAANAPAPATNPSAKEKLVLTKARFYIEFAFNVKKAYFCAVAIYYFGSVYKSYAFMACSFSNQRDRPTMDHKQFQDWLSGIDHLSPAQRQEAETVFMGVSEASSSLAAIEASVGESRQCPHCGTPGAISRGKARGLRRYQCKGCNKTFNAATGTPLSGLHRKDKWLAFGTCLSDGLTVRASAERCKFAVNTAFRWRHRFLTTDNPKARKLTGIVEVDETYVLQSQKGERNLERKARRRGGKARKRGLSDEQVPVLVAADRSGMTVSAVLPAVNADTLQSAIEPVVDDDIVLVTDGHRAYPPCAAALGVRHEALNLSGGERVRDAFHIQTLNNRHSQLKDFLRRYRGVATKYLDNYLRWFQRLQLENASPRACRATAIADPCIRFVN